MTEFTFKPRRLRLSHKVSYLLTLMAVCALLWSFLISTYYAKQVVDVKVENDRLRSESQRVLDQITEIEQKISDLKGIGATIDQQDFASAQYLAVNAGKHVPLPVRQQVDAEADVLDFLGEQAHDGNVPLADHWCGEETAEGGHIVEEKLASLNSRMAELQSLFEEVSSNIKRRKMTLKNIPSFMPVQGLVTSRFGVRRDPFTFAAKRHLGIDIAAAHGSPVYATADGRVRQAEYSPSYGWMVIVDHGNGVLTRYAHNSKIRVKKGDRIVKGELIADVGTSGFSTASHSHYEVIVNGTAVNPEFFMVEKPLYAFKGHSHLTYEMHEKPDA